MASRSSSNRLAAIVCIGLVSAAGAYALHRRSTDRRALDDLRTRRISLLERISKSRTLASSKRATCERLLAEARSRRKDIPWKGEDVTPPRDFFGVPSARNPLAAPDAGAEAGADVFGAFGPYACVEPELPPRLRELLASSDGTTPAISTLAEAEGIVDAEDAKPRRPPELPAVLADWECASGPGGYTVRCFASWWRPSTGEVVAVVRSSTYLGTSIGQGNPPGDLARAVDAAFAWHPQAPPARRP